MKKQENNSNTLLSSADSSFCPEAFAPRLAEIVKHMPEKERIVLLLYSMEEYTHRKIASFLQMSIEDEYLYLYQAISRIGTEQFAPAPPQFIKRYFYRPWLIPYQDGSLDMKSRLELERRFLDEPELKEELNILQNKLMFWKSEIGNKSVTKNKEASDRKDYLSLNLSAIMEKRLKQRRKRANSIIITIAGVLTLIAVTGQIGFQYKVKADHIIAEKEFKDIISVHSYTKSNMQQWTDHRLEQYTKRFH